MIRRALLAAYLVLLHLGAALLLWYCDPGGWRHKVFAGDGEFDFDRRAFWKANGTLLHVDGLLRRSPIVLLGDSLVEGLPADLVPPATLNLGLGGIGAGQLRNVIGRYPSLHRAKAIVVEIGINDLCRGDHAEVPRAEIESLAAALPANVPLVWSAVLPVEPGLKCHATSATIAAMNRLLASVCSARGNCVFADPSPSMAGPQGTLRPELHVGDGVHLSRRGYEAWTKQLNASLAAGAGREAGQPPGRQM